MCSCLSPISLHTNLIVPAGAGAADVGTEGDQSMGDPSLRNGLPPPGVPRLPPGVLRWPRLRAADLCPDLAALCGTLRCAGVVAGPAIALLSIGQTLVAVACTDHPNAPLASNVTIPVMHSGKLEAESSPGECFLTGTAQHHLFCFEGQNMH